MPTKTLTIELTSGNLASAEALAQQRGQDLDNLLQDIVTSSIQETLDLEAALQQADDDIENGRLISHDDVFAWLDQHRNQSGNKAA